LVCAQEVLDSEKVAKEKIREIDVEDLKDDPELERLHSERLAQLQQEAEKRQEMQRKGHGEYQTIEEGDFLEAVTKTHLTVVHFFHLDFERCKIMDKHLAELCKKYFETRFVRISAQVCALMRSSEDNLLHGGGRGAESSGSWIGWETVRWRRERKSRLFVQALLSLCLCLSLSLVLLGSMGTPLPGPPHPPSSGPAHPRPLLAPRLLAEAEGVWERDPLSALNAASAFQAPALAPSSHLPSPPLAICPRSVLPPEAQMPLVPARAAGATRCSLPSSRRVTPSLRIAP